MAEIVHDLPNYRLVRVQSLELGAARQVAALFRTHVDQGFYGHHFLHARHYQLAQDFITRFDLPLMAPDALHLAAASVERLQLVTADRQLARNAAALDIDVLLLDG